MGRRRDPLVGGGLETRGVVADWSAWLWQGEDEEVLSRLRLRTRTARPAARPSWPGWRR